MNILVIKPVIMIVGLIMRYRDVPPLLEEQCKQRKIKQIHIPAQNFTERKIK